MAEVFERPKKFTPEWFDYVWHYYKVPIISVAIAIFLLIITVVEIKNTIHYDVSVNYVATDMFADESVERFTEQASAAIEDSNNDGEKHASFTQVNFTLDAMQSAEHLTALENKLMALLASGEEMLFIFDKIMLDDVLNMHAAEGIFVPITEWCDAEISDEQLYYHENEPCAIALSGSTFMEKLGLDASGMYLAVRMNYKPDDTDLEKRYLNSVVLANAIAK